MVRKCFPGFTLIEMSFVLIIAGLIMGLSLPLFTTLLQQQKQRQTQANQEQVLYAIAAYLNQNGHLPAPALATATEAEQGLASLATCEGHYCRGHIPYRTLGLMENLAKNGYHQWMTYITSQPLVQTNRIQDQGAALHERNNAIAGKAFCDVTPGISLSLQLLDEHQRPLLVTQGTEAEDVWAVIVISPPRVSDKKHVQDNKNPVLTIHKGAAIKAVTRNNILAMYGHNPCQTQRKQQPAAATKPPVENSLEQQPLVIAPATRESTASPHQALVDPDDWQRPLPRQPLRERMPDDQG